MDPSCGTRFVRRWTFPCWSHFIRRPLASHGLRRSRGNQVDPGTAAGLIARIAADGQREQTNRRKLGRWMERDPEATQAWLAKNPVSEDERSHLALQQTERQP